MADVRAVQWITVTDPFERDLYAAEECDCGRYGLETSFICISALFSVICWTIALCGIVSCLATRWVSKPRNREIIPSRKAAESAIVGRTRRKGHEIDIFSE